MRETLFRGKRKDTGALITSNSILQHKGVIKLWDEEDGWVEVEPNSVCQYTGLTDKNGKNIFEGDIVLYNGEKHIVVFETRGGTGYFGIKIDHIETWGFCLSVPAKLMEVIGNIYDNPELAERSKHHE